MPCREYTEMKMIDVAINEKICYDTYTMCKRGGGEKMEIKDKIKELRESTGMNRKEFCEYFKISLQNRNRMGTRNQKDAGLCVTLISV